MIGRGTMPFFQRLFPGDDEPELGEVELLEKGTGGTEVAVVNRVKAAAQQPDL